MKPQQPSFAVPSLLLLLIIFLAGCGPSTPAASEALLPAAVTVEQKLETASPTASMTLLPVTEQAIPSETPTISPTDLPKGCTPPNGQAGWVLYTVQDDDTLYFLAGRTLTSVAQIQAANCRNADNIIIYGGQPLYLPFMPIPLTATKKARVERPGPTAPGPSDGIIIVVPKSGPPGTRFEMTIDGLKPNVFTIEIVSADTGKLIFTKELKAGQFVWHYTSPGDLPVGVYAVDAYGKRSHAAGDFTISAPPP